MTELTPTLAQQFALFNLTKQAFAIILCTHGPKGADNAFDIAQVIDRHFVRAYSGKAVNEQEITELLNDFLQAVKLYADTAAISAALRRVHPVIHSLN